MLKTPKIGKRNCHFLLENKEWDFQRSGKGVLKKYCRYISVGITFKSQRTKKDAVSSIAVTDIDVDGILCPPSKRQKRTERSPLSSMDRTLGAVHRTQRARLIARYGDIKRYTGPLYSRSDQYEMINGLSESEGSWTAGG